MGGEVAARRAVGNAGAAGDLAQREGLGALGVDEFHAGPDEPVAECGLRGKRVRGRLRPRAAGGTGVLSRMRRVRG
ncbi:hypothetical protein GCM10017752_02500 [Streptomyces roseoviridis]